MRIGGLVAVALALAASALPASNAAYVATTASGTNAVATAAAFSYSTAVTASSPWLWWRLGETGGATAADSSGNARTGTVATTGVVRGVDGAVLQDASTAYRLDGLSGCVASTASQANPTTFSLEAWFRSGTTAGGLLVGFGASAATASGAVTYDRQVYLTAAGAVAFATRPSGSTVVTSPGTYSDGTWHLVHATLGAGGQKLYVDGALVASSANTGAANVTGWWHAGCGTIDPTFTGAPANGYLAADIDEVAVYTTELSAATVAARSAAAPPRQPYRAAVEASRPWGWWRLGEASGSSLSDASGGGRTGTTAGSLVRQRAGVVAGDTATGFDGSATCAVIDTAVANPTTFSVEAWFRTTSTTGGPVFGLMDNGTATATGSSQRDRHVYLDAAGTVSFGVLASGVRQVVSSPSGGYNDGDWHQVVATLGTAGQFLYLDGALAASGATTTAQNTTGYWHIGCQNVGSSWAAYPGSNYFSGTIDEVAVYGTALDAPAVQRHFRAASVTPGYVADVQAAAPWLWWRLGETRGRQVLDASGNGRPGWAFTGGLTRRAPGVLAGDTASRFDGSTACVTSSVVQANPTVFSLEAWFSTTTTTGGWLVGFTSNADPTAVTGGTEDRKIYMTDAGTLIFGTWTGVASTVTTPLAYNDGTWHHVVATLGSGGQRLYVDGALAASSANTGAQNVSGYWHVGCAGFNALWPSLPTSSYFDATIDEVAVYAVALDPATVAVHFRDGATSLAGTAERAGSTPWATWRLGESSGTALADDSGGGHTATASAAGTTAAVAGVLPGDAARRFDGSSGCAVADSSTTPPQTFSVEAWFRASGAGGAIVGFSDDATPAAGGSTVDRLVYLRDDGTLTFAVYPGSQQVVTSTAGYADGAWHQVVATLGSTGAQRLYVDGSLAASGAATSAQTGAAGWWHVGCARVTSWPGAPASSFFAGTIDEVAVHTVELDAATVAYRYALVTRPAATYPAGVTARTPTLYWKLDETSGNPQDSSGNGAHGVAAASGVTRRQAPAVASGTAWAFDGTTGCAVSASSFVNPTNYSLELWFTTTSTTGGGLIGFTDTSAATSGGANSDRLIYLSNAGNVFLGSTAGAAVSSPSTYNDGQWHHVVGSVGTRGTRLSIDGALVASSAATTVTSFTGYWHVGCARISSWPSNPTSAYIAATIDDVAVHPEQLSDDSVRWHYLNGATGRPVVVSAASPITTIIGNGTATSTGDGGAATAATIKDPYAVAADAQGNVYLATYTGCNVRRIAPNGIVATVVGTGTCTSTGDGGLATAATLNQSGGVALAPDGSIYVTDDIGYKVRKVSTSGVITTVAGTGTQGSTGDGGPATSATLTYVKGLTVDAAGNLYIAQRDGNRIRKVDRSGTITTFIGNGTSSSTGDGGQASAATVNFTYDVWAAPDGSVYVPEASGCRVRKVAANGVVSTVAGTGTCSSTGDGGAATAATINNPHGITGDLVGNIYIAERAGNRIRRIDPNGTISTVAGTGTASSTGDGGVAGSATVNDPRGLALDPSGRLIVVEGNGNRVRLIG